MKVTVGLDILLIIMDALFVLINVQNSRSEMNILVSNFALLNVESQFGTVGL